MVDLDRDVQRFQRQTERLVTEFQPQATTQWRQGPEGDWFQADAEQGGSPGERHRRRWYVAVAVGVVAALVVTGFLVGTNEIGTHDQLHAARISLHRTSTQLAQTRSSLNRANGQVGELQGEVSNLQGQVSNLKGTLSQNQQLTSQIATVTDSLETCVSDTQQFESDFTAAENSGSLPLGLYDEASQVDTACAEANSQYSTLLSELNSASST